MKRRDIGEGMVFAVPLRFGKHVRGVVTRHSKSAVTVGYFFGPALEGEPALPDGLKPSEALLIAQFGDIPLVDDKWPVLGYLPGWDRREWPSARFFRGDSVRGVGYVVTYDDKDPGKVIEERVASPSDADLPADKLCGYINVEGRLYEMLRDEID